MDPKITLHIGKDLAKQLDEAAELTGLNKSKLTQIALERMLPQVREIFRGLINEQKEGE